MVRQRCGIEEQLHVLHVPVPEITQDEYVAAEPRLFAELQEAGLANGTVIDSALPEAMSLLGRPKLDLHGWIDFPSGIGVGVVVAADDRGNGVLAALDDVAMHLRPVPADKLTEALVDLLPPVQAGRGHSITVPMDMLDGSLPRDSWMEPNTPGGRLESDLRALRRLLGQQRTGGGRIYASARDDVGRRYKTQYPLTYVDVADGRWLLRQKAGDKPWIVATPATPAALTDGISDLLRTVLN